MLDLDAIEARAEAATPGPYDKNSTLIAHASTYLAALVEVARAAARYIGDEAFPGEHFVTKTRWPPLSTRSRRRWRGDQAMKQLAPRLLSWASSLENEARAQADRTSRLPFIAGHVALMPDAHYGIGSTVGSVIPTRGAIIPAAVGVDIGCGMIAANTGLLAGNLPDNLDALMPLVEDRIPAGIGRGRVKDLPGDGDLGRLADEPAFIFMDEHLRGIARKQMGSLGSGNHFVEVCLDEMDAVWIVLHSGSRGVGNKLAQRHIVGACGIS